MNKKLRAIINGWGNLIFKNKDTEAKAKLKAEICSKCDSNWNNICIMCGCPLPAKVRTELTNCPFNKWDNIK